jgi:hypothetical protein
VAACLASSAAARGQIPSSWPHIEGTGASSSQFDLFVVSCGY